ncbi:unnamed protein product [Arctogadus glacialis]
MAVRDRERRRSPPEVFPRSQLSVQLLSLTPSASRRHNAALVPLLFPSGYEVTVTITEHSVDVSHGLARCTRPCDR